jgi:hypothetical protein
VTRGEPPASRSAAIIASVSATGTTSSIAPWKAQTGVAASGFASSAAAPPKASAGIRPAASRRRAAT